MLVVYQSQNLLGHPKCCRNFFHQTVCLGEIFSIFLNQPYPTWLGWTEENLQKVASFEDLWSKHPSDTNRFKLTMIVTCYKWSCGTPTNCRRWMGNRGILIREVMGPYNCYLEHHPSQFLCLGSPPHVFQPWSESCHWKRNHPILRGLVNHGYPGSPSSK